MVCRTTLLLLRVFHELAGWKREEGGKKWKQSTIVRPLAVGVQGSSVHLATAVVAVLHPVMPHSGPLVRMHAIRFEAHYNTACVQMVAAREGFELPLEKSVQCKASDYCCTRTIVGMYATNLQNKIYITQ